MQDRINISDQITTGRQPQEELKQLAQEGFNSVVNLRMATEQDQPLAPEAEGATVRELGMQDLHMPVSTKALRPEQADRLRRELPRLPAPVYVHCHTGKRSWAVVMMHLAAEQGLSGQQALQKAEQMGFECDVPHLKECFITSID